MSPFPKLEQQQHQQQNTVILPIGYLHHQYSPHTPFHHKKQKATRSKLWQNNIVLLLPTHFPVPCLEKQDTTATNTRTHKLSLFSFRKGRTRHQNCNQKKTHWRKKKKKPTVTTEIFCWFWIWNSLHEAEWHNYCTSDNAKTREFLLLLLRLRQNGRRRRSVCVRLLSSFLQLTAVCFLTWDQVVGAQVVTLEVVFFFFF